MPRIDSCTGKSAVSSCSRRLPACALVRLLLLLWRWPLQLHAGPVFTNRRAQQWAPSLSPTQAFHSTNGGNQQHVVGAPFGDAVQASSFTGPSRGSGGAPAMAPLSLVPQDSQVVPPMVSKRAPFVYNRAQPLAFASLVEAQEDFRQATMPRGAPDVVGTAGLLPTGSTFAMSDMRGVTSLQVTCSDSTPGLNQGPNHEDSPT